MDNKVEELYVSRRMALADLQYTESLLQSSEKADDNSTGSALFYFAIICFFRPFKKSHAIHSGKFIKLDSQNVCPNHSTTFNLLEHERDTRIAHKDITIHNPKLHYWPSHDIFPIALKSSKVLWNDAKLLSDFKSMVIESIEYLNIEIAKMEKQFKELLSNSELT